MSLRQECSHGARLELSCSDLQGGDRALGSPSTFPGTSPSESQEFITHLFIPSCFPFFYSFLLSFLPDYITLLLISLQTTK